MEEYYASSGRSSPKARSNDFAGRFREIISDPLNLLIRRVAGAGHVDGGMVCLHNGFRVPYQGSDAYYGDFSSILVTNRGVHEPLEEFVFQELLPRLPAAPLMLELGAYWGHYSMWLKQARPDATVRLFEPDPARLQAGVRNFALNGLRGEFTEAFVGKQAFGVDRYLQEHAIGKVDVLHADIQGYEVEMLEDCAASLAQRAIDFLFVSTHSQALHGRTVRLLEQAGYRVEVSSDFDHGTTSFDGFVFSSSPTVAAAFEGFSPLTREQIDGADPQRLLDYVAAVRRWVSGAERT